MKSLVPEWAGGFHLAGENSFQGSGLQGIYHGMRVWLHYEGLSVGAEIAARGLARLSGEFKIMYLSLNTSRTPFLPHFQEAYPLRTVPFCALFLTYPGALFTPGMKPL